MKRSVKPTHIISVQLDKLILKAKFCCKIKTIIQTNVEKKSSSIVNFEKTHGMAIFNENIQIGINTTKESPSIKITSLIVQDKSVKMIGIVKIELNSDSIKQMGGNTYKLLNCPIKHSVFKLDYSIRSINNQVPTNNLSNNLPVKMSLLQKPTEDLRSFNQNRTNLTRTLNRSHNKQNDQSLLKTISKSNHFVF